VIGGVAVGFHGYVRATKDLDIVPSPDQVAGYDDLITLKRLAARPSDLEDLERLRQARGE